MLMLSVVHDDLMSNIRKEMLAKCWYPITKPAQDIYFNLEQIYVAWIFTCLELGKVIQIAVKVFIWMLIFIDGAVDIVRRYL